MSGACVPTQRLPEATPTPAAHPASLPSPYGVSRGVRMVWTVTGEGPTREAPGSCSRARPCALGQDALLLLPFAGGKELPGQFLKGGGGGTHQKGTMNREQFAGRGKRGQPWASTCRCLRSGRPPASAALSTKPVWLPEPRGLSLPVPTSCRDQGLSGMLPALACGSAWACSLLSPLSVAALHGLADADDSGLLRCCWQFL